MPNLFLKLLIVLAQRTRVQYSFLCFMKYDTWQTYEPPNKCIAGDSLVDKKGSCLGKSITWVNGTRWDWVRGQPEVKF